MDYVVIATAYSKSVRIYVAKSTGTVSKMQKIHDTWPTASAALGRFITISAMMGLMHKGKEKITLKIDGDGPIGFMVADANSSGELRADIENPHVYITFENGPKKGKLNVGDAVGNGLLYVTKDLKMKNLFSSSSELITGEIAEDFTHYFLKSEQTPSSVSAGVLVNPDKSILASGGFIIQLLPNCSDSVIDKIEKLLEGIKPISKMIDDGMSPEEILHVLSDGTEEILDIKTIRYKCNCNKNRFKKAIRALDSITLNEIIEEDHQAEIICNFCHKQYLFSESELIEIKDSNKKK